MAAPKRTTVAAAKTVEVDHYALRVQLGQQLQIARGRKHLKRHELSARAGVSERQIEKLEHARGGGSLEVWHTLAATLDLELAELLAIPVSPRGARESAPPYRRAVPLRASAPPATLLAELMTEAARLDTDGVRALLLLARRGASGTAAPKPTKRGRSVKPAP